MKQIERKTEWVHLRVSQKQKNKLQWLADLYTKGSISRWLVESGLRYSRDTMIKEEKRGL